MTIDPASGLISWDAKPNDRGQHPVTIHVDDGRGGSDTQSYVLT